MSAASPATPTPAAARPVLEQHVPERHVPERSCVACRRRRPQGELLRLSREGGRQGGNWTLQQGRQRSGRGAYLCADSPACWTEKRLRRMFGGQAATLSAWLATQVPTLPTPTPESTPPEPSMK